MTISPYFDSPGQGTHPRPGNGRTSEPATATPVGTAGATSAQSADEGRRWFKGHETSFTRNLKSALIAAAVVLAAAIAGLAFGISKGFDQLALTGSERMVEGAFRGLDEQLRTLTGDHARRDGLSDAVARGDADWIYANVAARAGTAADLSVIIAPNIRSAGPGALATGDLGWRADIATAAPTTGLVPSSALILLWHQLESAADAGAASAAQSTFARIGDDVWLLAAARVAPRGEPGVAAPVLPVRAAPLLVMGTRLTPELLTKLGAPYLIHDLSMSMTGAAGNASFALRDARGTAIAHADWSAPRPGWRTLANVGAPVGLITLVTVFVLLVAAFHFVGQARRLENALIREQKANRAKSQFVATVSHELRTPVTSIMGSLDLIASGALAQSPEKTAAIVTIARNNSRRLAALIEDLLQIQKMETGNLDYHFESIPIAAAVERAIQLTRPIASNTRVELRATDFDPTLHVRADQSRLEQVITNILTNAIKFSHPGGEVLVAVEDTPAGVRVSVTDHGVGIPEGARDQVFAPFGQVDSSDTRSTGGTGLGLNIARRIMDAHRGLIDYDSTEGQGSTFYIELPRVAAPA